MKWITLTTPRAKVLCAAGLPHHAKRAVVAGCLQNAGGRGPRVGLDAPRPAHLAILLHEVQGADVEGEQLLPGIRLLPGIQLHSEGGSPPIGADQPPTAGGKARGRAPRRADRMYQSGLGSELRRTAQVGRVAAVLHPSPGGLGRWCRGWGGSSTQKQRRRERPWGGQDLRTYHVVGPAARAEPPLRLIWIDRLSSRSVRPQSK